MEAKSIKQLIITFEQDEAKHLLQFLRMSVIPAEFKHHDLEDVINNLQNTTGS